MKDSEENRTMTDTTAVSSLPDADELEARIIEALKTVYDPEIPVDIYELGLIYGIHVDPIGNHADIQMTLTAPGCPVAGSMPEWVENAVHHRAGVESVNVELVWEPPWTPELMSMRAKLELNML
jgi:FeS assembly SUF system protein